MDGKGRVAVREVMVVTPAVSNLIREGKTHQLYSAIETGGKFGMVSMDSALLDAVRKGYISPDMKKPSIPVIGKILRDISWKPNGRDKGENLGGGHFNK